VKTFLSPLILAVIMASQAHSQLGATAASDANGIRIERDIDYLGGDDKPKLDFCHFSGDQPPRRNYGAIGRLLPTLITD
jgi:hypothetical protein